MRIGNSGIDYYAICCDPNACTIYKRQRDQENCNHQRGSASHHRRGDIARACSVLQGLTYALDLSYSTQLNYTLEVFQKLFLEPPDSKLSTKVQALKKHTPGVTADWK